MTDVVHNAPPATEPATEPDPAAEPDPDPTGMPVLVVNPTKVDDVEELAERIAARAARWGLPRPQVLPTTEDDPGRGQAAEAVRNGATLVIAAGGDGTVRAVAEALVGTGIPLGVLPLGTGNLLVRNLGLPTDVDEAIEVALSGRDRTIDVGRLADGTVFAVMAGAGFDAAMMRDAPDGLKKWIGWPAYLVGGARSLRRARVLVRVRLDDGPWLTQRVRTVLIGNLGQLQGGLCLLPAAEPDDGLLDVGLVAPRRAVDWVVLLTRALIHRDRPDPRLRTFSGRRIEVRLGRPQPRQVDGDVIGSGDRLDAEVVPASLRIRTPHPDGPPSDSSPSDSSRPDDAPPDDAPPDDARADDDATGLPGESEARG